MTISAEEVLTYIKELFESYLEELNGTEKREFSYGEKTAYVECLEIVQKWERASEIGLNYDIEKRFPL